MHHKALTMEEDLDHICDIIDIGRRGYSALVDGGCTNLDTLLLLGEKIVDGFPRVKESDQKELINVITWYEAFEKENGRKPIIPNDFNEHTFNEFKKKRDLEDKFVEHYLTTMLRSVHSETTKKFYDAMEEKTQCYNRMEKLCIERVMTDFIIEKCGNFDYQNFIRKMLHYFHTSLSGSTDSRQNTFIVAGKTQSGKSSVKGVLLSLCGLVKIPLVILTKGVAESQDLYNKMKQFAKESCMPLRYVILCSNSNSEKVSRTVKDRQILEALEGQSDEGEDHGGCLVVADTHHQIEKAIKYIQNYRKSDERRKFAIIVDECDSFYRTEEETQKMEQAYRKLMAMDPFLKIMISATPIPLILKSLPEEINPVKDYINLEPNHDYLGLDEFQPLKVDNEEKYLQQNVLTVNTMLDYGANESIPYTNADVKDLYTFALSKPEQKGILLLDCTCPRVYANCNVFQKASGVQDMYRRIHKNVVVITFTGKGVKVKFPGKCDFEDRNCLLGDVINEIDNNGVYGLETPIFVFGYIKMRRGISFR